MSGASMRGHAVRSAQRMVRRGSAVFVLSVLMAALALAIPTLLGTLAAAGWPVVQRLQLAPEVTVFAHPAASPKELRELQSRLEQTAGVALVRLITRDEALAALERRSGAIGALPELRSNPLPDALVVQLRGGASTVDIEPTVAAMRKLPRVDSVHADLDWYRKLRALARAATWVGTGFGAAAVVLVGLILIGAVRLQTAASIDEIRALRLIGADRRFIVRPFAYLGGATLLLAALLAVAGVWVAVQALQQPVRELAAAYGGEFTLQTLPWYHLAGGVATATVLGAIVASIAARRALRGVPD
jgi:cell division transport system permease protein